MRIHPQAVTFLACPKTSVLFNIHKIFGNLIFNQNTYASSPGTGGSCSPQQKKRRSNSTDVDVIGKQLGNLASPSNGKANNSGSDSDSNMADDDTSIDGGESKTADASIDGGDGNTADGGIEGDGDTMSPGILHSTANPLNWVCGNFTHTTASKKAVKQILQQVTMEEFHSGNEQASGLLYTLNYDKLQDEAIQSKLMSCIMPELVGLFESVLDSDSEVEGFDINRRSKDDIDKLVTASKRHFKNDYNDNDDDDNDNVNDNSTDDNSNDDNGNDDDNHHNDDDNHHNDDDDDDDDDNNNNKEGSVYLKFIVMTVSEWINACQSVLEGERCGRNLKGFVRKLKKKLEHGIEKGWWEGNDSFSMPYIGESSAQSFAKRMKGKYPSVFYSFGEQNGAAEYELKIATVEHGNAIQSKALESFVATLLSQCTMISRRKKRSCQEYISCRCLRHDCTAFNAVICGDHIGYGSKGFGTGNMISDWNKKFCNNYRNVRIMECFQRDVNVLAFVIQHEHQICEYINNNPRENAWSLSVQENKDALHERVNRNDITVEDECRYFGYLVGSKFVEEGIGIHDPEYMLELMNDSAERMYKSVKDAYQDPANFVNGTFFPPVLSLNMVSYFRNIRVDKNNLYTREYRRSFWLSKEEDLEHLLYEDLYKKAKEKMWNTKKYGENADFIESLSKVQEGKDNDDDPNKNHADTGVKNDDDDDDDDNNDVDGSKDYTDSGVYIEFD